MQMMRKRRKIIRLRDMQLLREMMRRVSNNLNKVKMMERIKKIFNNSNKRFFQIRKF
jgi:two-component sensor histidine kinase